METRYSGIYRVFHWAIALSFLLLIVTVFLRLTWMNKDNVADIIEGFMSSADQVLSRDQAIVLAKQIRKPMWNWHIYSGYVLAGLFLIRFSLPLFGEMKFPNPLAKRLNGKEKFRKWMYVLFYAGAVVTLVTGLIIVLGPKDLKRPMEEIHVSSLYYLIPFVVIHLAGVLIAEFTSERGIISQMVSGKKIDGKT